VVEYHGDSYGASYDTILHQFSDFFNGYNTMVAFGKDPIVTSLGGNNFMILYGSERITEYSDDLKLIRRLTNVRSA
jgi:hypothetical protein